MPSRRACARAFRKKTPGIARDSSAGPRHDDQPAHRRPAPGADGCMRDGGRERAYMRTATRMRIWGLALAMCAGMACAAAPTPDDTPDAGPAEATGTGGANALTAADAAAWLDGMVPWMLERNDVAGAAVAIVKDGQVLLQRGYGYADVATGTPV